jgi:hypothetical protein
MMENTEKITFHAKRTNFEITSIVPFTYNGIDELRTLIDFIDNYIVLERIGK